LNYLVGAPLAKLPIGRRRKLRMKGWMEGGHKKKGSKDDQDTNDGENHTTPTDGKGKGDQRTYDLLKMWTKRSPTS
jgi:hypothetical protein